MKESKMTNIHHWKRYVIGAKSLVERAWQAQEPKVGVLLLAEREAGVQAVGLPLARCQLGARAMILTGGVLFAILHIF